MGTTTKGQEFQVTGETEAVDGTSKGQPTQGVGPLLGAADFAMSIADAEKAKDEKVDPKTKGDPVNVLTGDVVVEWTDLELAGVIPVAITRNYNTAFREQPSIFGVGGWVLNLEQWIDVTEEGLRLREASGRYLKFSSIDPGSGSYIRSARCQIDCIARGSYRVTQVISGLIREFSTTPGDKVARLRRIVDPHSNHVDLHYEGERLAEVIDSARRRAVFSTDEQGRVIRVEVFVNGPSQTRVSYGYHPDGELAWIEDALGYRERFEYDGHHRMVKRTLRTGFSFHYRYDPESGQCVKTWGDGGLHEYHFQREYKDDHILVTTTGTEEPRVTKFNFEGDQIEDATFDRMFIQTYTYDADHLLLSVSNAAGETTSHEYDERGHRIRTTDAMGNVTMWEYDADRPRRSIAADGLVTEYRYNGFGELTGVRPPSGAEYGYDYDEYGRMVGVSGPDGTVFRLVYDEHHNAIEEYDARGGIWVYTYDLLSRPLSRTDPLGATTRVEYDAMGQPIRIVFPDASRIEMAYDPFGNISQFTDSQGRVTQMSYMGTGRLVAQLLSDGTQWRFEYDAMERLKEVINPKCERYRYFYDHVGRVEREETFDGRAIVYSYDSAGRLLKIEKPDESYARYTYDSLGNLVQEDTPHGPQKFERDTLGRLVAATVVDGPEEIRVAFTRDAFGRIVTEQQGEHCIENAFDIQGRRIRRTVPGCGTTNYHYDTVGAITRVEHESPSGAKQELMLDRDALGREIARRSRDGKVRIELAYDAMDRLVEQKIQAPSRQGQAAQQLLSQRNWSYDLCGRVQQVEDSRWGTTTFEYDQLGQLTSARRGQLHEVFEYQANGSLIRALNELVPENSVAGPGRWDIGMGNLLRYTDHHEYQYDRCHRRTAKIDRRTGKRTEYIWDCRSRLREVRLPDGRTARYFYDAFGRRVRKELTPNPAVAIQKLEALGTPAVEPLQIPAAEVESVNAFGASLSETLQQLAAIGQEAAPRITHFLWDGNELAAELDSETGPRGHVHYPGSFLPLLQIEHGEILVVVTDHLGTPRDLLSGDGTVRWSAAYTAWGKIHEEYVADAQGPRGPPPRTRSPFSLLGQYFDEETGLAATRFRYWDADTGRWCSPDPFELFGGENLMGFDGCPTVESDPLGLDTSSDAVELRKNMVADKIVPPDCPNGAHHLIASNDPKWDAIRTKVTSPPINMDINSADNGVFLVKSSKDLPNAGEGYKNSLPHSRIHTAAYREWMLAKLAKCNSKAEVQAVLKEAKEIIMKGDPDGVFASKARKAKLQKIAKAKKGA